MGAIKKVYISVDIEGMEGVVSQLQTLRSNPDFNIARKRLAEDVNAAIKACLDCGAEEVIVCDGHADMENIILEDLHPEAKLISGAMRSSLQMQMIELGFDAVIMFGHAGAGVTKNGVIDHTYNGRKIYNIRMNGETMNTEGVLNAVIAGHYDIPVVAAIGDKAYAEEMTSFIPNIETIVVKEGTSRFSALSIHPTKAREKIYEGVKKGLMKKDIIKPLKLKEPITMEIDFKDSNMAETAELIPGVKRPQSRTIEYTGDAETIFKLQALIIFRLVDQLP
ncbi:M55 family metallopeptidase [Alkaliphilus transvaalensis]|uniref:M55 family metallopeptidase n=1 Tax=Alkaliphilus transvaalensis TaxID=114628 RepID=UPI0006850AA8|nr:M55 family metallopeptidase [Alkaliphilus transvaalensis]